MKTAMNVINGKSMVIHAATYVRKHLIGEIYRLCCGKEVYIPFLVGWWCEDDRPITCRRCLAMKKKEAEEQ